MSMAATIAQFGRMLENLDRWLQAGVQHAETRKFDPNVLAQARLAPDQYPLIGQVQSACDTAKFTAAYLADRTPPSHPDTEQTIDELRARIRVCREFLGTFSDGDFAGGEERRVSPRWLEGRWVLGAEYVARFAIPNFYFHVTTAYAILRHNGVALGKMDFIGAGTWAEVVRE